VQKIVRSGQPPPPTLPAVPPTLSNEPSFAREALARSVFRTSPSDERLPETTIELDDAELKPHSPPAPPPRKPPAPRHVENTLSMSDADLVFEPTPETASPKVDRTK
jgi:hypothetical protein